MPTTPFRTWTGQLLEPVMDPDDAILIPVNLGASLTLAAGTVLGEVTASPGTFKAYASGSSDGSEVPKGVLAMAVVTDGSGNITSQVSATDISSSISSKSVPMYAAGKFRTQDLTGMDANAVTKLGGHLIVGTLTTGIVEFG